MHRKFIRILRIMWETNRNTFRKITGKIFLCFKTLKKSHQTAAKVKEIWNHAKGVFLHKSYTSVQSTSTNDHLTQNLDCP